VQLSSQITIYVDKTPWAVLQAYGDGETGCWFEISEPDQGLVASPKSSLWRFAHEGGRGELRP